MSEALLQNEEIILDEVNRQIIQATQSGLPLVSRPYHDIAKDLGITASEVISRMKAMQEAGIIRRIAAVPNHYALGYKGNGMSVWDVPSELVNELGEKVGSLDFVSHCYHRPRFLPDWPYNLFAMVHAHNREEALLLVDTIAKLLGENDRGHDVLFSKRILKKTGMRLL
ncbi:MAG: AsnC family transcriptional regulator [Gammaproteobacteria bacterium]|nr:AsnC family transcriptional regulator [Gammaproteobacteria bacterium]